MVEQDQDQNDDKTKVIVEPKAASPPEPLAGEDHFCQDSLYYLPPFKFARHCWLPSRSRFGKRTRATVSRTSHHHRRGRHLRSSPSTQVGQAQEHLNLRRLFFPLYCSSSAQEAIHHHTHWSRVLHHNGGPNQYKSRVFLCCEFVEFVREILAS